MLRSCTEMNTCSAAGFGGRFFAAMTPAAMSFAGTVHAVAAVFLRVAVTGVRLCFPVCSAIPAPMR